MLGEHALATAEAETARLRQRLKRERAARREAEAIAERGLRAMFERKRQAELLERIATTANEGASIRDVMAIALEHLCCFTACAFGCIRLIDIAEPEHQLDSGVVWHVGRDYLIEDFDDLYDLVVLEAGCDLSRRVLATGKAAWIADFEQENAGPTRERGSAQGLRSALCFPVLARADCVATVALFRTQCGKPDADLLHLFSQIGLQLGMVVQRERALLHDASHDPLTRLPNRVLFLDRLGQSIARLRRDPSARFAVLFIDLDEFKTINDSLGHLAGDELLIAVARRLGALLREKAGPASASDGSAVGARSGQYIGAPRR